MENYEVNLEAIADMKAFKTREFAHSIEVFAADDPGEDQEDFDRFATADDLEGHNEDGAVTEWAQENAPDLVETLQNI